MLNHQEVHEVLKKMPSESYNRLMSIVPNEVPAEKFEKMLEQIIENLGPAERAQTSSEDGNLELVIAAHASLSTLTQILEIFTDEIRKVRSFTDNEQRLISQLDQLIGRIALKCTKVVSALKQFDTMKPQSTSVM